MMYKFIEYNIKTNQQSKELFDGDISDIYLCGGGDSGGGGGGGYVAQPTNTTSTSTINPPDYIKPYYQQAATQAQNLYNTAPNAYPGSLFVPFNQLQNQGLNQAINTAQTPSLANPMALQDVYGQLQNPGAGTSQLNNLSNFGQNAAMQTGMAALPGMTASANGAYLNSNPYLDSMFNSAANSVTNQFTNSILPSITSQFAKAGSLGSTDQAFASKMAVDSLGNNLNSLASNIYGTNYANERSNMLNAGNALLQASGGALQGGINAASGLSTAAGNNFQNQLRAAAIAPSLEQQPITQGLLMSDLGDIQRSRQQQELAGQVAEYYKQPMALQNNLTQYLSNLQAAGGQFGTTSSSGTGMQYMPIQPSYGSSGMGMLGTGLSTLGMLSGGPMGLMSGGLFGGGGMLGLGGGGK